MRKRKIPALGQAGNTDDETTRALEQLNWLRVHRPRSYDQLMIALAKIVAVARADE